MNIHEYDDGNLPASGSSNLTNSSNYSSKISRFADRVHTLRTLHIMAGFCQIFLGAAVVLVAILGLISPLWLSALLSMVASATTMLGLFFLYATIMRHRDPNLLLENAIKRVTDAQN